VSVAPAPSALATELGRIVGPDFATATVPSEYLVDASVTRGVRGRADALVRPGSPQEVADVLAWCYAHDVAIVPRGGGTGYAAGAVPEGGVVLGLERLQAIRSIDPEWWRMVAETGVTTGRVRQSAREYGLYYPPNPGALEQSHIGGNVATNAGGPHCFKHGVTRAWVQGLEVVVAPGEVVQLGGHLRKDVAGYDLVRLLVGSEGTLGIITAVWLRLIPAPEARHPILAVQRNLREGIEAIGRVYASGAVPAAIEYLDGPTLAAAGSTMPMPLPEAPGFAVLVEADGLVEEAAAARERILDAISEDAVAVHAPLDAAAADAVWRWREGIAHAVYAVRGGKLSEDIAVPLDRLEEAIAESLEAAQRHGLDAVSFGHAGDGNIHTNFLIDLTDPEEVARAEAAGEELFEIALRLGGTISGEHGVGRLKAGHLHEQWPARAVELHDAVKAAFDPKGLLNPGAKRP
jgi:glycolate oxidase subunit GlcD